MLKSLLLCFMIFASLGVFLIGPHSALAAKQSPKEGNQLPPVAKEANQKPPASEDVKKQVEEARPDKKPECTGMKAQSRPASEACIH
ncbi:MAG: hypothetical protein AAB177_10565 [Nitrospirota bacterium]